MPLLPLTNVPLIWKQLLIEVEFARNYNLVNQLSLAGPFRNPVIDNLLPSLLQIRCTALLDKACNSWIKDRDIAIPGKKHKNDLNGRLSLLVESGCLSDGPALHALRNGRNYLAHEPLSGIDWESLDAGIDSINTALEELGLVGKRPVFEAKVSQSGLRESEDPKVDHCRDISFTISCGNDTVSEMKWVLSLMGS